MRNSIDPEIRRDLEDRRHRLHTATATLPDRADLAGLLAEVDAALARVDDGSYGRCETCHDPIEAERLRVDPLLRTCLDHLNEVERRDLERDLELASRFQSALLPRAGTRVEGWDVAYHYEPAGAVSGDYCDLVIPGAGPGSLFFLLGDISGKGVAASMLMAHLHAILRTLIAVGTEVGEVMQRANRLFCESVTASSFATLVFGRAESTGAIELGNAGHPPPLLLRPDGVHRLEATGVPLGLFCHGEFPTRRWNLSEGDTLFLYTDGLSEARDPRRTEYGLDRLSGWLSDRRHRAPSELVSDARAEVARFRAGTAPTDDLTLMAIRRTAT